MSQAARSHRSAAQGASRSPYRSVLASDATPRCASMASADRQMIGDATPVTSLTGWGRRRWLDGWLPAWRARRATLARRRAGFVGRGWRDGAMLRSGQAAHRDLQQAIEDQVFQQL